jgi:Fur family ferric uptake transcriptional regulator
MSASARLDAREAETWPGVRERLRSRGLRWTPQRRTLVDVLATTDGHVTGAALVEACRAVDPETTPSTVYRTLDVLEELGLVSHSHGVDGREEYHVRPSSEHGHLVCAGCGGHWEVDAREAAATIVALRRRRGFEVDLSHLTIVGRCAACRQGRAPASAQ